MTQFKVGDKVRILRRKPHNDTGTVDYNLPNGDVGKVGSITDVFGIPIKYQIASPDYYGIFDTDDLELVTNGDKPMERKTYKLLKDMPTLKKGALLQEQCEDGTQPYEVITPEFNKDECTFIVKDRKLVEDQPDWFVQVFKVQPEYMTQPELDAYKAFLKTYKPTKAPKATKVAKKTTRGGTWTPERRKAAARRMRKMHRQGKMVRK